MFSKRWEPLPLQCLPICFSGWVSYAYTFEVCAFRGLLCFVSFIPMPAVNLQSLAPLVIHYHHPVAPLVFPRKYCLSPLMSFCNVLCTYLSFPFCQEESFNLLFGLGHCPGDLAYHFSQPGDEMKILNVPQWEGLIILTSLFLGYHKPQMTKWEQMHPLQGRCLHEHARVCVFLTMILNLHSKHSIKVHFPESCTVTTD